MVLILARNYREALDYARGKLLQNGRAYGVSWKYIGDHKALKGTRRGMEYVELPGFRKRKAAAALLADIAGRGLTRRSP